MQLVVDENISRHVIARLRAAGHDVVAIGETRAGIEDKAVLAVADATGRLLVTEDQDFGELVVGQGLSVLGVLLLRLDPLSNDAEAARVAEVVERHGDGPSGHFTVVEPARIRQRPIDGGSEPVA